MLIMEKDYSKEIPHWLFKQLPYNHYSVNVNGKSMHVMEKGAGRPIVFVHGNPMWGYLYRKILDIFNQIFFESIARRNLNFLYKRFDKKFPP